MADAVITTLGAGGGSGGGDLADALGTGASLDGTLSLAKQDSSPSGTTDYAKIFTKEVEGSGGSPDSAAHFTAASQSHIEIPNVEIGTGPYSVEFFIRFTSFSSSGNNAVTTHSGTSSGTTGYFAIRFSTSAMTVHHWDTTYKSNAFSISATTGVWYHVAVCRDGSDNLRGFFTLATSQTAVLVATLSGWNEHVGNVNFPWTLGRLRDADSSGSAWYHDGEINDFLVTKTAKYTSAYTIPVAPFDDEGVGEVGYHFDENLEDALGSADATSSSNITYVDGHFASTVLFHFDDNVDDSSGEENDGTATSITYATSTAGSGGSGFGKSAVFDGSSSTVGGDSYVVFPDPEIGTGDFTVECWVRFDDVNERNMVFSVVAGDDAAAGYLGLLRNVDNASWGIHFYDTGFVMTAVTESLVNDTWYHVAIVRNGTTWIFFRDGVIKATISQSPALTVGGYDWVLGRLRTANTEGRALVNLTGQIDEFRVTKNAKYTGAFTPASAPFAPGGGGGATATHVFVRDSAGNETQLT